MTCYHHLVLLIICLIRLQTSDAHRIELRQAPSATTMHIGDAVDSKQTDADTKVNRQEPDHSCINICAEFAQCESREKGVFQIFSAPNECKHICGSGLSCVA